MASWELRGQEKSIGDRTTGLYSWPDFAARGSRPCVMRLLGMGMTLLSCNGNSLPSLAPLTAATVILDMSLRFPGLLLVV